MRYPIRSDSLLSGEPQAAESSAARKPSARMLFIADP
jgi:hypothetical protein